MPDVDLISDLESGDFDAGIGAQGSGPDTQIANSEGVQRVGADPKPIVETPEQTDKAPSLREQLTSAFKGEDGKPSTQDASVSADPAVPPVNAPTLTKDSEGRYRQVDGTFASAEQIAAFEAASAAPQQQQQQQTAVERVTSRMTALEAEKFNALPPELQQYVAGTTEALDVRASKYQEYDLLEQVIGPRRAAYAQNGVTVPMAINELLNLSDFAGSNPQQFIMWFAQQNGVDLDAMLDEYDAQQANVDPTVSALQQQVGQLTNQLSQITSGQQEQQQQQYVNVVEAVATEKDATGALKRPYFADLGDSILPFVSAMRSQNPAMPAAEILVRAYDAACWASPTIRGKMQEAADAQRRQQQREAAARARNASASINGAPVGDTSVNTNQPARSIREEIKFAMDSARG